MGLIKQSITNEPLLPNSDKYAIAVCPLPDCGSELYITWHSNRPVYLSDNVLHLSDMAEGYTSSWEIGCTDGHTILLPVDHTDDYNTFGQECYLCAPDGGESNTPVYHDDLGRLRQILTGWGR